MVDVRVHQAFNQPLLHLDVDRTRAVQTGFTQRDVANNLLISLSGSGQTTPTYWLNPATGVSYTIATQTPQYRIASLQDIGNIPIAGGGTARPQVLEALASVTREAHMAVVSHYDVQPVIDVFGAVQGRDLGGVAREMARILDRARQDLPRGRARGRGRRRPGRKTAWRSSPAPGRRSRPARAARSARRLRRIRAPSGPSR